MEKDMTKEVIMPGFSANLGYGVEINTEDNRITFTAGPGFAECTTNALLTDNFRTVGTRNIQAMHDKLDHWILTELKK